MNTLRRRQVLAIGSASLVFLGCARQKGSTLPAPVALPPAQQIPVDLDVVLRLDLKRLRSVIPLEAAEALARLLASRARDAGELLAAAVASADQMWIGIRPDVDPRRWDNVVILHGDFSGISSETIGTLLGPSRDLGGGFLVYDVLEPQGRTEPARLYTYHEERWLFASEAEVDALERVIEGRRADRETEPPARGLASITAQLSRMEGNRQASALRAFEKVETVEGSVDVRAGELIVDAKIGFPDSEDADLAERALLLLARLVLEKRARIHASGEAGTLSVQASFPLEMALGFLLEAGSR